jgi:hypothetical protein
MKTLKILTVISIIAFTSVSTMFAQGFEHPAKGKAVVYFVRINSLGSMINFKYFDKDKFIGKFNGKNYMRYECSPGEHLFWASSERKYFITSDLNEGGTYIVVVEAKMGAISAAVKLYTAENEKRFKKAVAIINKKEPKVTAKSIIDYENTEMKEYIAQKLDLYENGWKAKNNYPHISAEMAIPSEKMK